MSESVPVGDRAAALGHAASVERVGGRFRLRCSCGFATPVNAKRKAAFDAATAHVYGVVRTGVSLPGVVGGRL